MKSELERLGYQVWALNSYQFRINSRIDIYPGKRRYFDLQTKEWGTYIEIKSFLKDMFHEKAVSSPTKEAKIKLILDRVAKRVYKDSSTMIPKKSYQILSDEIMKFL